MPDTLQNQMEFPWAGPGEPARAPQPKDSSNPKRPLSGPTRRECADALKEAAAASSPAAEQSPETASHTAGKTAKREAMQRAAEALLQELMQGAGLVLRLHITNNSSTMMTLRKDPGGKSARLRLHHMFLDAPPDVRRALIEWIRKPKAPDAGEVLGAFIHGQREKIRPRRWRTIYLRTRGRYFNLQRLFDEVNAAYFYGKITAKITWGKLSSWPRRSIRFGSYMQQDNIIRIHPLLDQEFVPEYVVRYIVFHEMLHALLGVEEGPNGRRRIHPPEFKRLEAAYPDFARASAWCEDKGNFRRVLRLRS